MWYLILCFALFLFLSDNTISNKILSLTFTLYLTRLEFSSTFTLNEYLLWTISLLHLFWFHTYLNFKKVYLIDTVLVSCVKIFELCVIVLPFVSLYLPEIIAQHLFKMDNIFLLGVITCLVVRETGYSLKADVVDFEEILPFILSGDVTHNSLCILDTKIPARNSGFCYSDYLLIKTVFRSQSRSHHPQ